MTGMEVDRRTVLDGLSVAAVGATGRVAASSGTDGSATATTTPGDSTQASFRQTAKLRPGDGNGFQNFGSSVALDGPTALVGAYRGDDDQGNSVGTAHVIGRDGNTWTRQAELTAVDADTGMWFGSSVALDGETALVGAPLEQDPNGRAAGAAYAFVRAGDEWTQQAKLVPEDGDDGDSFGWSVALDGDTALVGAEGDEDPHGEHGGSAYVFRRRNGEWRQQAKLVPDDGSAWSRFGGSVALSRDTALVGADGANTAYVFGREGGNWTEQATLTPGGGDGGRFGIATALSGSGETALVGAYTASPKGSASGAAYVFGRNEGRWTRQATLVAADGDESDAFGNSVAVTDETALVGADQDEDPNGEEAGSVYVFEHRDSGWAQRDKLAADDGDRQDGFGSAVATTGTTALVGANVDEGAGGAAVGSAYVFERGGESGTDPTTDSGTDPGSATAADGPGFGPVPALLAVGIGAYRRYRTCDGE